MIISLHSRTPVCGATSRASGYGEGHPLADQPRPSTPYSQECYRSSQRLETLPGWRRKAIVRDNASGERGGGGTRRGQTSPRQNIVRERKARDFRWIDGKGRGGK